MPAQGIYCDAYEATGSAAVAASVEVADDTIYFKKLVVSWEAGLQKFGGTGSVLVELLDYASEVICKLRIGGNDGAGACPSGTVVLDLDGEPPQTLTGNTIATQGYQLNIDRTTGAKVDASLFFRVADPPYTYYPDFAFVSGGSGTATGLHVFGPGGDPIPVDVASVTIGDVTVTEPMNVQGQQGFES